MARRRFFVEGIYRGEADLAGDDAEHLARVLRAEAGQRYEISDDGRVYLAEIVECRRQRVRFRVIEELAVPPACLQVILLAALIKFDRFEWMIEKTTEAGVDMIIPVAAERSERGLEKAADKRLERWLRIVKESSQQSRRARLPEVRSPVTVEQAVTSQADCRYFLDEAEGVQPLACALPPNQQRRSGSTVVCMVGPEGGWVDGERDLAAQAGFVPVSLGPGILRAETAAIAAVVLIRHAWWSAAAGPTVE